MQFDVTLNIVWLVLGVTAIAAAIRVAARSSSHPDRQRWLLVIGVALIVAALFPYISATDDVLRIDHDRSQHSSDTSSKHSSQPSGKTQTDNLMRLYATMDTPLIVSAACLVLTFFFVALVCFSVQSGLYRGTPQVAGRSPPLAALLAS